MQCLKVCWSKKNSLLNVCQSWLHNRLNISQCSSIEVTKIVNLTWFSSMLFAMFRGRGNLSCTDETALKFIINKAYNFGIETSYYQYHSTPIFQLKQANQAKIFWNPYQLCLFSFNSYIKQTVMLTM